MRFQIVVLVSNCDFVCLFAAAVMFSVIINCYSFNMAIDRGVIG